MDLLGCGFAPPGAAEAPTLFNPNEPDGKYDLDVAMPAQRQVGQTRGEGGQDARLLLGVRWGRRGGGQGVRLRSARSAPRAGHVRRARPDKICLPAEHAEHVP